MAQDPENELFEASLRALPREMSIKVALRATARVLPLLIRLRKSSASRETVEGLSSLTLANVRAVRIAVTAAKFPDVTRSEAFEAVASSSADDYAVDSPAYKAVYENAVVRFVDRAGANVAAAFADVAPAAAGESLLNAAWAAQQALMAGAAAPSACARQLLRLDASTPDVWSALRNDKLKKSFSLSRETHFRLEKSTDFDVASPFDQHEMDEVSSFLDRMWGDLKAALLARPDDNWQVWTDWYDAWLDGRELFPLLSPKAREDLEIGVCLIPDKDWKCGPAHVNAIIRGMIDAALAKAQIKDDELPRQTPRAANFGPNPHGQMAYVEPTEADRLSDHPEVVFFYGEARTLCGDLHGLGRQHLGESTFNCADRMTRVFPHDPARAVEREIWAAGNALRRKLSAHDAIVALRDFHPDRLESGAVERLRAFVEAFNQLAFADPKLRARDERRPGPREAGEAKVEVALIAPVSRQAADNEEATTRGAAQELREQTAAAKDADESVVGRNAAAHARDTHRNFHSGLLVSAFRAVREVRKMAKGEAGFVTKEMFGGAYKAIGAGALTATGAVLTGHVNWEAIQIVVQNLPTLRQYAPLAFEAAPAVAPLLDYLEATVEIEDRDASAELASERPSRAR